MKEAIKTNLLTGIVVLLPISLFLLVLSWLYNILDSIVEPFTAFYDLPRPVTVILVLVLILIVLFLVGVSARTRPGTWFFASIEKNVFSYLPGYRTIKQLVEPFVGDTYKKSFKSVALVDAWNNGTFVTAFITDRHKDYTTVFVPTGPNPTSGMIFHVPNDRVKVIDAKMDYVLRSVIAVGSGSAKLIEKLEEEQE